MSGKTIGQRPRHSSWGGFWLANGADVSVVGWCAQGLLLASMGGLAYETALIELGTGTWPVSDTPWISLAFMSLALTVMLVDMVVVALLDWLARRSQPALTAARLADVTREYLALRPDIRWQLSDVTGGFEVQLWPVADPSRTATLHVTGDRSIDFRMSFGGHAWTADAFSREENVETLCQQLGSLVGAMRGPSAVLVDRDGDRIVSTELVLRDPTETDAAPRRTPRAVWSRVRGRSLRREVRWYTALQGHGPKDPEL